jgi:hypothetical protein
MAKKYENLVNVLFISSQKIKEDKSKEENKNLDFLRKVIIPFILITTFSYKFAFK